MAEYIKRDALMDCMENPPYLVYTAAMAADWYEKCVINAPAADVVEAPRWIPVTERLPEIDQRVIVFDTESENGYMSVCFLEKDEDEDLWWAEVGGNYFTPDDFTHWMPLPKPPECEIKEVMESCEECGFCEGDGGAEND